MIQVNRYTTGRGEVVQFRMAAPLEGIPPYWVAAYLVGGLLIDTGCANTRDEFLTALAAETGTGAEPRTAVNTHYHEDHIGADRALQVRFGTRVFAPGPSVPLIKDPPPIPDYRLLVWGRPEPCEVEPLGGQLETEGHRFLVVPTPGHSPDHVALVEPEAGWCFSGDLYTGARPRVAWRETDVAAMIASLRTLAGFGPFTLFTGPGEVVENGSEALLGTAAYLEDLVARGREMETAGLGPDEVRQALFGGESSFSSLTGGEFSSANLTRAVLRAGRRPRPGATP